MLPVAILAGGLATRLRPVTQTIPKSMVEVAGEPFVAHQLRQLKREGVERVVFCVGHLGEQIRDFVRTGEGFGLAVIEAMASGTPVVVSRIAPFTEYLADADAFWATPTDTDTIAAALEASLDPDRRAPLVERGQRVAARFDWASSARTHLARYIDSVRAGEKAHA